MTINAGIITRVSTLAQADNTSPDDQLDACREYCQIKGYSIVAERFETISGAFVLARSGFNELLTMAADGDLSVIVADKPDRLGRGDVIANLEFCAKMNNARVEYAKPGRDVSTIEGVALKAADQLVSGAERILIRERTMNGKRNYAKAGRVIETRFRPYGYSFESEYDERGRKLSCSLVIRTDEEPEIVRNIFEMCAIHGMTTRAIAMKLTEMQIPTMGDKEPGLIKKHNGLWRSGAVYNILNNRTYCGEWYYAKRKVERLDTPEGVKSRYITRNAEDSIPVIVPAIVSRELWEAAQTQLNENRKKFHRPPTHEYLLTSRIRCAHCTGAYGAVTKKSHGRAFTYYTCRKNTSEYGEYRCWGKMLRGELADTAVWEAIKEAMMDEERLLSGAKKQREEASRGRKIVQDAIAALDVQIQKANSKIDRLLDMHIEGHITKAVYLEKRGTIEKEIKEWNTDRAKLTERLGEYVVLSPEQELQLEQFRADIQERIEGDVPIEEKRKLLDILRVECIYDSDTGEIAISGLLGQIKCHPNQRLVLLIARQTYRLDGSPRGIIQ